jgi:hypothetical protein
MNLNRTPITVKPSPVIQEPKYITSFNYAIIDFDAFKEMTFLCITFDDNGHQLSTHNVEISGEEYQNWGNDDTYIVNLLSSKIGLSPIIKPTELKKIYAMDTSGNPMEAYYLKHDSNGNIILPQGFLYDISQVLHNSKNKPVCYGFLQYDFEGRAIIVNPLLLDPNNKPILPPGYFTDPDGFIRHSSGVHIVIAF